MLVHVQPLRDSRKFVVRRYGSSCNPFVGSLRSHCLARMSQVKPQREFSSTLHRILAATQGELQAFRESCFFINGRHARILLDITKQGVNHTRYFYLIWCKNSKTEIKLSCILEIFLCSK